MTKLFLGAPIREPSELRFFRRLRTDLEVRGIVAIVLANFVADPERLSRQVDFLIWTRHRLVHIELKTLDLRAPLDAPANGHWTEHLRGGQFRTLSNGSRQALDTTFAISDHLRRIASAAGLPGAQTEFFRHIDTVVCFQPEIPRGSRVQPIKHVSLCCYADLLDRFGQDGASPPGWTAAEIELVAQELGLYAEQENRDEAKTNLTDLDHLASYRSSLPQIWSATCTSWCRSACSTRPVTGLVRFTPGSEHRVGRISGPAERMSACLLASVGRSRPSAKSRLPIV
ncbi:nuclease-related domain-containing protein [Nocardia xishanensis]|uniref:nuclease-related domain-containing protein n=1 Tax=Nocardia xishanensis TaxID=238964 RepID=UPI0033D2D782